MENVNPEIKFYSTVDSKLNKLPILNGQLIFVEDTAEICLDLHNKRTVFNDFIICETDEERQSLLAPSTKKFYFVQDTLTLWKYDAEWMLITAPPIQSNVFKDSIDDFPDVGNENTLYITETKIYKWNSLTQTYTNLSGLQENDIKIINGGSAN